MQKEKNIGIKRFIKKCGGQNKKKYLDIAWYGILYSIRSFFRQCIEYFIFKLCVDIDSLIK